MFYIKAALIISGSRAVTFIANPLSAVGTMVEMKVRFQIGSFKSRPVFVRPNQLLCFLVLNGCKSA